MLPLSDCHSLQQKYGRNMALVPSACHQRNRDYEVFQRLSLHSQERGRYRVYQQRGCVEYIGTVFREGKTWFFWPDGFNGPINGTWYFGDTRCAAIAGFLRATNREVPSNE